MAAAHDRNLVALDRLTAVEGIDARAGEALRCIVRVGGGREAIGAAREIAGAVGRAGALDALEDTWDLLEAAGVARRVRVDFGILRSFDYYTGLIVEAYAPGLGLPLGGGGRYDDVLAAFDAPMPAAGFALSLERVMIALAEQGVSVEVTGLDAVLGGDDAAQVARAGALLRMRGVRVRVVAETDGPGIRAQADRFGARHALLASGDAVVELDGSGRPAAPGDASDGRRAMSGRRLCMAIPKGALFAGSVRLLRAAGRRDRGASPTPAGNSSSTRTGCVSSSASRPTSPRTSRTGPPTWRSRARTRSSRRRSTSSSWST